MAKATTAKEAEPTQTPTPTPQPEPVPEPTPEPTPAPQPVGDVENIHDAKALMRQRLMEKYTKTIQATGRYDEVLKAQEQERLYQKKLIDSGAIGMSPADKAALDASIEYEKLSRGIEQYNPDQEESQKLAAEILGDDVSKLKKDKMLEGMGPTKGKVTVPVPPEEPKAEVEEKPKV